MAESNAGAGRRKAKETAETARDAARETVKAAQQGADQTADAVRQQAGRIGDQIREAAESLLHEQQGRMADAVHGIADLLRRTADGLEREENRAVARYADQAAAQVDRFSEAVRHQQLNDLLANVETFARRQPVLFIVGALTAGFVAGRVLGRPGPGGRGDDMTGENRLPGSGSEDDAMAGYAGSMAAGPM